MDAPVEIVGGLAVRMLNVLRQPLRRAGFQEFRLLNMCPPSLRSDRSCIGRVGLAAGEGFSRPHDRA